MIINTVANKTEKIIHTFPVYKCKCPHCVEEKQLIRCTRLGITKLCSNCNKPYRVLWE